MAEYVVIDKEQLESDLTIVADSIRAKANVTEKLEFPLGMKSAVEAIQSGGGESFNPLDYASFGSNGWIFYGVTFPEDTKLKFTLHNQWPVLSNQFSYCKNLKECEFDITKITSINLTNVFMESRQLTKVKFVGQDVVKISGMNQAFSECTSLETIEGCLGFSNNNVIMNNTYYNAKKLKDITFDMGCIYRSVSFAQSPLLTDVSIQSIIDGLADLTGSTAQTLTLHADVKAKLTETQIATITGKNWTLA